ncbi:MAG: hypothetical protein IKA19_07200 [Muribaculaceae bacterium]|nr:hypothetical protein [Muribaculaceae bacterium]
MNNQRNLQQILSIVYEVEGLLLLAQSKGNDTPNEIYDLIQEKLKVISQSFPSKEIISDNSESINQDSESEDERSHGNLEDDYDDEYSYETEDERSHGNLEDDYDEEYSYESEDERSHGNLEDDYDDLNYVEPENEHSPVEIEDIDKYTPSEIEADNEENSIITDYEPIETQIKDESENDDFIEESDFESVEIVSEDIFESIDSETEELDDDIIELDDIDSYDDIENDNTVLSEPITIEEKLAIQNTRDLRTAFTINDRFRFKRELFGNKDTELADALNMISAMSSFAEVQEYFFEDLEWDKDNPEVIDFLKIISNYFNNRN